jgi:hypothetical protein
MRIELKAIAPKKGTLEKQAWAAINKQLSAHIESRLRNIRCSEHHKRPQVRIIGVQKKPEFQIEGCCQKLIDEATQALK